MLIVAYIVGLIIVLVGATAYAFGGAFVLFIALCLWAWLAPNPQSLTRDIVIDILWAFEGVGLLIAVRQLHEKYSDSRDEKLRRENETFLNQLHEKTDAERAEVLSDNVSGVWRKKSETPVEAEIDLIDDETPWKVLGSRFAEFTVSTGHTVWMRFLPEAVEFEKPEICILVDVAAVLRTFCPNETVVAAMYFAALAGTIPGLEETYEGGFGLLKCNEQLELVSSVVRGKLCWTPVSLMTMAACDKAIGTSKTEEFARLWQELVETAHLSLKNFSKNPTSRQYLDKVLDGYRPMFEPYLPSLTPMDIASACELDVQSVPLEKALESFNAMCEKVNALSRKVVTRVTENSYANRAVGERDIKALVAIAEKRGKAATLLAARYKSEAPNVDCTFLQEYEGLTTRLVKNWNAIYAGVGHQSEESPKTDSPRVAGGQGLAAVAGMSVLKAQLQEEVVDVFRDPERFKKYGISIPNGILFFGPPGCGKTYIARQLANELGYSFFEIVPSDIGSSYVHGTALKIRETFDEAAKKAPSILFIDEFEALVPSRDSVGSGHQYKAEEVNEFLTQMDGCSDRRVLLIAATNQP